MACSKFFSFAEVVKGRDASVPITDDKLHAVKFVMVFSGKGRDDAGKVLRCLSEKVFSSANFSERKTGGAGNSRTKLVSFEHAIELIMVLPGKVAKETRKAFVSIIHRYLAGDKSLVKEIQSNAESSSPIAQLARATLPEPENVEARAPLPEPEARAAPPEPEDIEARRKRIKREDIELVRQDIKNVQAFMGLMNTIRPDWMQADAGFRQQTENLIKNIYFPPPTNVEPAVVNRPPPMQDLVDNALRHPDTWPSKRYGELSDDEDSPSSLDFGPMHSVFR
jgi:hypothetical protein